MDEEEKDQWLYKFVATTSSEVSDHLRTCLEEAERKIKHAIAVEEEYNKIKTYIGQCILKCMVEK